MKYKVELVLEFTGLPGVKRKVELVLECTSLPGGGSGAVQLILRSNMLLYLYDTWLPKR